MTFWSATGQKLATYQLSAYGSQLVATATGTNQYFGGKLIKNAGGYVTPDRLGSIGKYFPYGQERPSATQDGKEKFATYFRDSETGLDYADQRYHQPGMGRFMTPDPYSSSASIADPGSWNRYAYAGGDPVNRFDPLGLCNAIIGGITQSSDQAFGQLAIFGNADQIYPYAGLNGLDSVIEVGTAALGRNQAIQTVYDGIMAAAADPGPINIVAYSGGAGAFAGAVNLLPADVLARIANVIYLSPGAAGDIPTGPWHTQIFLGADYPSDAAELFTTWNPGTALGSFVHQTNCNHTDTDCFIQAARLYADWNTNAGDCSHASIFSRPPGLHGIDIAPAVVTSGFGYIAGGAGDAPNFNLRSQHVGLLCYALLRSRS